MPRIIVCDVNDTLLDVGALEPHFKEMLSGFSQRRKTDRQRRITAATLTPPGVW